VRLLHESVAVVSCAAALCLVVGVALRRPHELAGARLWLWTDGLLLFGVSNAVLAIFGDAIWDVIQK